MKLPNLIGMLSLILIYSCSNMATPTKEKKTTIQQEPEAKPEAIAFDGRPLYSAPESEATTQHKDSLLAIAKANYAADSTQLDHIIWLGRRTAYLSRYQEAIAIYSKGLEQFPDAPELYRHRGHRYISTRQLEKAIADFEKAAELAKDRPIEIEPDGLPNKLNIPLSNLQFNIWYHWGLAHYLKGDFAKAAKIYAQCMSYSKNPDLLCATSDWLYMTYRRLGQADKASKLLEAISPEMVIIENASYFNRLLLYKALKEPQDLLDLENTAAEAQLNIVTQGYGVGNWYWYNGDKERATEIFKKVLESDYWSAFGYIAAEADLVR